MMQQILQKNLSKYAILAQKDSVFQISNELVVVEISGVKRLKQDVLSVKFLSWDSAQK